MKKNKENEIVKMSKIPNSLFQSKGTNISVLKKCKYDEKVVLVLDYLYGRQGKYGDIMFTFGHMIDFYGYKVDYGRRGINGFIIQTVKKLVDLNILEIIKIYNNASLDNVKIHDYIECKLNIDYSGNFTVLLENERNKILDLRKNKINVQKLLLYYCYLKHRMYNRKDSTDIHMTGGRANVCFPTYGAISEDLGLNSNTITLYNEILHDLNLIRWDNAGLWYRAGDKCKKIIESPNTYVLYDGEDGNWKDELKEGIAQYKKLFGDERIFLNKRTYKNNDRKLNGKIGALTRLKNENRATPEQLIELENLINQRDLNKAQIEEGELIESENVNLDDILNT